MAAGRSSSLLRVSFLMAATALCVVCLLPRSAQAGRKKARLSTPHVQTVSVPTRSFSKPPSASLSVSPSAREYVREKMDVMRNNGYAELARKISRHTNRPVGLKLMILARESGGGINLVNPANKTKGPLHMKLPSAASMIRDYGERCLALRDGEGQPLLQSLDPKHFDLFLSTYRRLSSMSEKAFQHFSLSGEKDKRFASLWGDISTLLLHNPAFSMVLFDVQIPSVLQEVRERLSDETHALRAVPPDLLFACTWACGIDRACEVIRKGGFFKSGEGRLWLQRYPAFQAVADRLAPSSPPSLQDNNNGSADPRAAIWQRLLRAQNDAVAPAPKGLF